MNTMIKSALFAAVIVFGGVYAADAVYKNMAADDSMSMSSIAPAAGSIMNNMAEEGVEMMEETADGIESITMDVKESVSDAMDMDDEAYVEDMIEEEGSEMQMKPTNEDIVLEKIEDGDHTAQVKSTDDMSINASEELPEPDAEWLAKEMAKETQETMAGTQDAVKKIIDTEPAVGNAAEDTMEKTEEAK